MRENCLEEESGIEVNPFWESTSSDMNELARASLKLCKKKGWSRDWSNGGCYLHLEASEFIESLRGKGRSMPAEEAADILFVLGAMIAHYKIDFEDILKNLVKLNDR